MTNYKMSEKDEFLSLIQDLEKMMKVNPTGLLNDSDIEEKIQRFNFLSKLIPSFNLSEKESEEVGDLWNSLVSHIRKRAEKLEAQAQLTPQEQLLQTLKIIINKWKVASTSEKKELISDVSILQTNQTINKMTPEQVQEYNELMTKIREMSSIEKISLEEYSEIESSELRKF